MIRVRIGGIDAPERRQAFSRQSTDHLSSMVHRQIVTVECGTRKIATAG
jgi:endonuclease YncB( thermonuclease family)